MATMATLVPSARRVPGSRTLELGKLRLKRGVSLEEIAETTKISMRFLRAIEDEEFEKLPGGIFRTSYLRQYATAIGLEEAKLIAHCAARTANDDTPERVAVTPMGRGLLRWLTARG